jgi:hypothetical protein
MNFDRSIKKGNFDRWIKRWRTDVPTANNCLCIMVMAYLISKTEFFIYIVDRWTDIDIDGQIQI